MISDKPTGADNQQGSRGESLLDSLLTPQRLHAELLATDAKSLEAYLQGALRDGTRSVQHRTHRIGAAERDWLVLLKDILASAASAAGSTVRGQAGTTGSSRPGRHSSIYRSMPADSLGLHAGLTYVRGYFDADGGMPVNPGARLYFQFAQSSRDSLRAVAANLEVWGIATGRIHNPSVRG